MGVAQVQVGVARGAEVQDSLGSGQVLNVAVLQEGRCGSGRGTVGGKMVGVAAGAFILVLYRVLETVGAK